MSTLSAESRPAAPRNPGFITRIPTDDSLPRWRAWVTRHPIGGALLAGAVATQFATVFGIWFPGFGLPSLNWPVACYPGCADMQIKATTSGKSPSAAIRLERGAPKRVARLRVGFMPDVHKLEQ